MERTGKFIQKRASEKHAQENATEQTFYKISERNKFKITIDTEKATKLKAMINANAYTKIEENEENKGKEEAEVVANEGSKMPKTNQKRKVLEKHFVKIAKWLEIDPSTVDAFRKNFFSS